MRVETSKPAITSRESATNEQLDHLRRDALRSVRPIERRELAVVPEPAEPALGIGE
jgi:hypothetical protein